MAKLRAKNRADSLEPVPFNGLSTHGVAKPFYKVEGMKVPMLPFGNLPGVGPDHKRAANGKLEMLVKNGLAWDAILNAYTPEFKLSHTPHESFNTRPKGTDWFAWAPYTRGPRKKAVVPKIQVELVTQAPPLPATGRPEGPWNRVPAPFKISRYLVGGEAKPSTGTQEATSLKISRYWLDKETGVSLVQEKPNSPKAP